MYHFVSAYLCLQWLARKHFRTFQFPRRPSNPPCWPSHAWCWSHSMLVLWKMTRLHALLRAIQQPPQHTTHNIHTTTTWWNIWQETPRPQILSKSPLPFHGWGWGGAFCSEPPLFSAKWLQYTVSILQNGLSITHGVCFSRKWLGLLPRVDHFVDWCRSEDRPCFYDCVEKSSGKELWLNLFLLDPSGSSRILQPYPNFDTDCSLEDLCQNSILLLIFVFALGPFLWLEHTGTGKSFHLQKDCQHIVGKKIEKYSCCKSCMKKMDPPPKRRSEDD